MSKITLIISIFFLTTSIKGQVMLIDSITNEPIVGANMYSKNGLSLGLSDIYGVIKTNTILNNSDKILIQHISYDNKEISAQILNKSNKILLNPRQISLDSIVVQNPKNYDYVVLKGYFRTYDLFNNKPRYFYDGIIEYYIPIRSKGKVYHKLLAYRLFENKEAVKEYIQIFGKALSDPPKTLTLASESSINQLPEDIKFIYQGDKISFIKKGLNMGFIQKTKDGNTQFYFDMVPPQSKISRSFLKIRGEQYRGLILENYSESNIKNPSQKNLISRTRSTAGTVQRKKANGFIPMETFEEFYVLERKFLQKADVDNLKKSFTKSIYLDEKSNYSTKFWMDLEHYNIPPLSKNIIKQLNSVLEEK